MIDTRPRMFSPMTDEEVASLTPENGWSEVWLKPDGMGKAIVNYRLSAMAYFIDDPLCHYREITVEPDLRLELLKAEVLKRGWTIAPNAGRPA